MNSKGITPVIAVVLLLTISIAATSAAYKFMMNAQESAKQNFEQKFSQQEIQDRSDLDIEHMYKSSGGYAIIAVRNTGSIRQIIENKDGSRYWTLYVNNRPIGTGDSIGTGWKYMNGNRPSPTGRPVTLSPGSTININTTQIPAVDQQNSFRLIGRYGSKDIYICQGSQC